MLDGNQITRRILFPFIATKPSTFILRIGYNKSVGRSNSKYIEGAFEVPQAAIALLISLMTVSSSPPKILFTLPQDAPSRVKIGK
jgi:hypothetical protein